MNHLVSLILAWGVLSGGTAHGTEDRDGDGVRDSLEQALIERFRPRFLVDPQDCAGLPAELEAFSKMPRVRARNAAIYARVSPAPTLAPDSAALELHYYHLWARDCGGLNPHDLDVEHVSVLVTAPTTLASADAWTARFWYAAAHEDTVCDTSNAARADAIDAVTRGADVWVSSGKHASYLSPELCGQRGCGGDSCRGALPMLSGPLVNLGEANRPLVGAVWIASPDWPLAEKLGPDFNEQLLAKLDASNDTVLARVNGQWRPAQFSLSVGGDVIVAVGAAGHHGGEGLAETEEKTGSALGKGLRAVGRALGRVARALGGRE